ncbi:MAG: DUF2339 domain-containing protein [Armatimonadota bacterium]|nr:DUF2339 domain-containing protein [Armatimonadota bacterium]
MEEDRLSQLHEEVQRLARRVAELEQLHRTQPGQPPPRPAPAVRPPGPPPPSPPPAAPVPSRDLEAEIGGNWLNRIGAVALVLGAGFFLKYAIDNRWIDETGRIILGVVVGLGLIFGGERLQKRGLGGYAQGLAGAGVSILYLSVYTAFSFYRLIPQGPAFGFMALVTIAAGAISVRYNALSIAILGIIGGFLTPVLTQGQGNDGGGSGAELLSYVAVLDLGVLGVTYYKNWRTLNLLSGVGTLLLFAGWYWTGSPMTTGAIMLFLTIFYAIFAAQSFVQNVVARRPMNLADLTLVILTPVFYFWASYSLLKPQYYVYLGLFALAMCAVYLWFSQRVQVLRYQDSKLRLLFLAIAAGFLIVAVPIQLKQHWVVIGWAAEAAVVAAVGYYVNSRKMRYVAVGLFGLAIFRLLLIDLIDYPEGLTATPFVNVVFGTFLFVVAMMAGVAWLSTRYRRILTRSDEAINAVLVLGANGLLLFALCREVLIWLQQLGLAGTGAGSLAVSAVPAVYAAIMLIAGIALRYRPARIMALVLFGIVIVKAFLNDVWLLERLYRIIAFVGLGALLLLASYVYQVQGQRIRRILSGEEEQNAE